MTTAVLCALFFCIGAVADRLLVARRIRRQLRALDLGVTSAELEALRSEAEASDADWQRALAAGPDRPVTGLFWPPDDERP